jgi:two-component system, cell cycle response regulator DivK
VPPDNSKLMPVLLVEDAEDEREMYAESLRLRGYRTLQASTAPDAIRLATELLPIAVVTDIVLRGPADGFALTRTLKEDLRTQDTPVIVLTGRVFEADREAARLAGCDLFLMKPCLPDELVKAVRRCAAVRRLARIRGRPASLALGSDVNRSSRNPTRRE